MAAALRGGAASVDPTTTAAFADRWTEHNHVQRERSHVVHRFLRPGVSLRISWMLWRKGCTGRQRYAAESMGTRGDLRET